MGSPYVVCKALGREKGLTLSSVPVEVSDSKLTHLACMSPVMVRALMMTDWGCSSPSLTWFKTICASCLFMGLLSFRQYKGYGRDDD